MRLLVLTILLAFACDKGGDSNGSDEPAAQPGAEVPQPDSQNRPATVPEPPAVSGQLVFSVDVGVDPESVEGYVVGYQDLLQVEQTQDGQYFIDNIPAGEHDVIVTAGTITAGLVSNEGKKRARRLKKIKFLAGVSTKKDKIDLPPAGAISGVARLAGQSDHAGINVYIPGTSFSATTDTNGTYTISPFVPVGENNLYFEKDGYHRGQIEAIDVVSDTTTAVPEITLELSTGAEGFVSINSGAVESDSRVVTLSIGATDDAVLMKVAEDELFSNLSWVPIVSTMDWTFDTPGSKNVYVKFADANGLESSAFSASITVNIFTDGATVSLSGNSQTESNSRTVTISVTPPKNAATMKWGVGAQARSCFVESDGWVPVNTEISTTIPCDGNVTFFIAFKDTDGFSFGTESDSIVDSAISTNFDIILFPDNPVFSLASGSTITYGRAVPYNLTAPSNSTHQMVCEASDFSGCSWESRVDSGTFTFNSDGSKTLYIKFKDADDFESDSYSDTVTIDHSTSQSVSISSGASATTARAINLSISATEASQMKLSNTTDCSSGDWEDYSSTKSWSLSEQNGTKTVSAVFKGPNGNESDCKSDTILFDDEGPTGSISIENGASETSSHAVIVNLSATDVSGVDSMYVSLDGSFTDGAWENFNSSKEITVDSLSNTETATISLSVKFKDSLGNESSSSQDSIALKRTFVSGNITSDTTWSKINSPFLVTANVNVLDGNKLTIEAGTTIKIDSDKSLVVAGELIAIGTNSEKITFTSSERNPAAGDWGWLRFTSTAVDASFDGSNVYQSGSILQHVTIEYGGGVESSPYYKNGALYLDDSAPYLNNAEISNCSDGGIFGRNFTGTLRIDDSIIRDNYDNQGWGGGILLDEINNVVISNTEVHDNSGSRGGGIDIRNCNSAVIQSSEIYNNEANQSNFGGAGILIDNCTSATIKNNSIYSNLAQGYEGGGGILLTSVDGATVETNLIYGNSFNGYESMGGGVGVTQSSSNVLIQKNYILNNSVGSGNWGGGVGTKDSNTTITNNIFSRNSAACSNCSKFYGGGGLGVYRGNVSASNNLFFKNTVSPVSNAGDDNGHNGAALYWLSSTTNLTFNNNSFLENSGTGGDPQTYSSIFVMDSNDVLPSLSGNNVWPGSRDFALMLDSDTTDLTATGNYWGYTNQTDIDNQINADGFGGVVDASSSLSSPNLDAPITPPLNVSASADGSSVTITWDSSPESDVSGYYVHYDTSSTLSYGTTVDAGDTQTHTVNSLSAGTYYFSVTAYDSDYSGAAEDADTPVRENQMTGNESGFSTEVQVTIE